VVSTARTLQSAVQPDLLGSPEAVEP
jgi:hypothetical protein